ncbi:MAG: EutN/CcmL family microcompartment protein [Bryobacteraceae bacterium]|jgi:microcompartment protein CcmK/EutM
MLLGRVVGCVWATAKDPQLEGVRLLVIQPVTPDMRNTGKRLVCSDSTGARSGDIVYWVRGKEASFPFLPKEPPTDASVVGIVDTVHLEGPAAPEPGAHRGRGRRGRAQPGRGKPAEDASC